MRPGRASAERPQRKVGQHGQNLSPQTVRAPRCPSVPLCRGRAGIRWCRAGPKRVRRVVVDQPAAAAGEDWWATNQARRVLRVAGGRGTSALAFVWPDVAADLGAARAERMAHRSWLQSLGPTEKVGELSEKSTARQRRNSRFWPAPAKVISFVLSIAGKAYNRHCQEVQIGNPSLNRWGILSRDDERWEVLG